MVDSPCRDCPDHTPTCRLNHACQKWEEYEEVKVADRNARREYLINSADIYLLKKAESNRRKYRHKRKSYGVGKD